MKTPQKLAKFEWLPLSRERAKQLPPEEYAKAYDKGWRYSLSSSNTKGLDHEANTGGAKGWAWEDGYLDAAADREKWHLATCVVHDNCP